jgi:DNA-binding transcriptional regulator GbsR (MarR family)
MAELSVKTLRLSPAIERFILHWGDLGGQWGVNRSVAQIHALLFVSERPLTAEEIADALGMARSNVSNSLKELLTWNLARRTPILGDRRDHFEAEGDVWEMAAKIVAMRKARELDPAAEVLRACLSDAKGDPKVAPAAVKRLSEMQELVESLNDWYAQVNSLPNAQLKSLAKLGSRAIELLSPFLKKKAEKN